MNLKEQLAAKKKELAGYQSRVKAGEISDDDAEAVKALIADIENLATQIEKAEEQAELVAKIGALGGGSNEQPAGNDDEQPAKSLGAHFIKDMKKSGRSLKDRGTFVSTEYKAAGDTHIVGGEDGPWGPIVTDVDRGPVLPYQRPLVVADLFGSGTVSGNAVSYPVFGPLEGETGEVAEAGQKPQVHVGDPTWVTDVLSEIAGFIKISDNMAEDIPYIVSEINSTLLYDLQAKEEDRLLNGTGTNGALLGVLNRDGVNQITDGGDSNPDRIYLGISQIAQASPFAADGIVINPEDYEAIRLSKDSNGQYFGGGFFTGAYGNGGLTQEPPLWGRRTVVTNAIAQGTVLVGAFNQGKVFRKGGIKVESTNSHEDDFTNDRITIRARERLLLQVKYPAAFSVVTLEQGS